MLDTATICPECLREDALHDGFCRFCRKYISINFPIGVLPPGVVLGGRYLTGTFIGQGGFGTIYKALDLSNRRVVAIKEYFPTMWCSRPSGSSRLSVTSPEEYIYGLKHFKGEVEILRSVQSVPEVVRLYDSFEENNTAYYVMEFLEGDTLQSYLKDHGNKISYSDAVTLLMPAILAIKRVHDGGATHRDISPDNIFLPRGGGIRIIDFGAAASKNSNLAQSFIPVEKEGFSPPEQHTVSSRGDTQGSWSDVYAMAGTLFRCTMGKRPPAASARLAGDQLDFSRDILTERQIRVLEKNLSLDPKERDQDMLSFAHHLLEGLSPSEARGLRERYPALNTVPAKIETNESDPTPPRTKGKPLKLAAYLLDLFFFQVMPIVFGFELGRPLLFGIMGLLLGIAVTWLMTASYIGGGPGEVLCGRTVTCGGRQPQRKEALLYCLIRICWPLKAAEGIYYLRTNKSLNEELSGCRSQGKEDIRNSALLRLNITEGFFRGNTIELEPGRYVVGRNPEKCNIVFPMIYNVVSRVHLELIIDDAKNIFVINRSIHGTVVNGRKLAENEEVNVPVDSVIAFGQEIMTITSN